MNPKIYHGNAYNLSRKIKDQSVQLIYTDPPYGTTHNQWDKALNLPWFWEFAKRVLTPSGVVVLHSSQQFSFQVVPTNLDWFRYSYTWIKSTATGHLNAKKQPLRRHEELLVFYPPGKGLYLPQMTPGEPYELQSGKTSSSNWNPYNSILTVNSGNRYPTTVLDFPIDRPSLHPTQKPLALAKHIISTYSNQGDLIVDPFAGSGTALLAAKILKRKAIGIESNKDYLEIIKERLAA